MAICPFNKPVAKHKQHFIGPVSHSHRLEPNPDLIQDCYAEEIEAAKKIQMSLALVHVGVVQ